jgi:hypothetical protein
MGASASTRVAPSRESASKPSFTDLAGELEAALRLRLRESPVLTLAVAGGVGYVLGGGLTVGVLTRVLQVGLRVALAIHAEQVLADWVSMGRRRETARGASNRGTEDLQ